MPSQKKRRKEVMICQEVMEQAPRAMAQQQEAAREQAILPKDLAGKMARDQVEALARAKVLADKPEVVLAVVKARVEVVVKKDATGLKKRLGIK